MQIYTYTPSDFYPLLYFLNKNMEYDELNSSVLHEKLYNDPDWDPGTTYIAKHGGGSIILK